MRIPSESLLLAAFASLVMSCEKDEVTPAASASTAEGKLTVEITDAPIDDADVEAVFVTVAEVRVNGDATAAFTAPQTIELSNYHGGATFELASDIAVDAAADARVEVVLDIESDADGAGPGAYVLRADGTKDRLAFGTASRVTLGAAGAFDVDSNATTRVVADLDLRKAVKREDNDGKADYTFLSEASVRASSRLVAADLTGEIEGQADVSYDRPEGEQLVVYAYAAGGYDHDAAVESDFANATTSASVTAEGGFTLAFLPAGDYELVTASYVPAEGSGRAELRGTVAVDALLGVDAEPVSVSAESSASLELNLTGLML